MRRGGQRAGRMPVDDRAPGFPHFRTSFRTCHRPETRMDPHFPHFRTFRTCICRGASARAAEKPAAGPPGGVGNAGANRPRNRASGPARGFVRLAVRSPAEVRTRTRRPAESKGGGVQKSRSTDLKTGPFCPFAGCRNRQGGLSETCQGQASSWQPSGGGRRCGDRATPVQEFAESWRGSPLLFVGEGQRGDLGGIFGGTLSTSLPRNPRES